MDLHRLISHAQHMPNIPRVVQELIESFGDQDVSCKDIATKLNKDQAMTAKVLRMANSASYGGHRSVGSINDAVVLLGFNALRTIVLASGLTSALPTPAGFDIKAFWARSFTVGNISKWVAQYVPDVDAEVAFTCGMIHNIGGLLIHILVSDTALEVDRIVSEGADRIETEQSKLGFTYTEAGAELAHRWKFPEEIVDGIYYQQEPLVGTEYKALAGIVYIAKYLFDSKDIEKEALVSGFPSDHAEQLHMDVAGFLDNIDKLHGMDSGIEGLLDS